MTNPKSPSKVNGALLIETLTSAHNYLSTLKISEKDLKLLDALNSQDPSISSIAESHLQKFRIPITQSIIESPDLRGDSNFGIKSNIFTTSFYPHFASQLLLIKTLETGSPIEAVNWLKKILDMKSAQACIVHTLCGVLIEEEIELANGINISPIEKIPESRHKEWALRSYDLPPSLTRYYPTLPKPRTALHTTIKIEPVIIQNPHITDVPNKEHNRISKEMADITLLLTAIITKTIIPSKEWLTFIDQDLEQANIMFGRSIERLEILPSRQTNETTLNSNEAKELIDAFFRLQRNFQDTIRIALIRLRQALARQSIGDQAVEISIALEALLGDNAKNEMTHKIKVRAARFLGGANTTRTKNAQVISRAYDIRSSMVHTGHVNATKTYNIDSTPMNTQDIINHTIKLCSDIIKKIINNGSIPDWVTFDILEHPSEIMN